MAERVLLLACDERIEQKIRQKLESEGSIVAAAKGIHDLPQALASFNPTVVLVDDKKIGALQVTQALDAQTYGQARVVTLSEKKDEYGAVLGVGCLDAIVDWAMEGCLYILGIVGLLVLALLAGFVFRGCG